MRVRGTCSVEDCGKPHFARSWCEKHYNRWRNNGDPLVTRMPNRGSFPKSYHCTVAGCEAPRPYVRGLCPSHYRRWKRYGIPTGECVPANRQQCTVEGCERCIEARGLCSLHYGRFQVGRDVGGPTPLRAASGAGYTNSQGYRRITVGGVKMAEHRYVMEQVLGRPLLTNEDVHHRNGIRSDNRPENLELWVNQPRGQRVEDLVAFIVEHYQDEVRHALTEAPAVPGISLAG